MNRTSKNSLKPRLSYLEQERLAYAVAALHYEQGLTQSLIASRLNIGRMHVQRLLSLAEKLGYVEPPRLRADVPVNHQMEGELLKRLPTLKRVAVALTHPEFEEKNKIQAVASLAAKFWQDYASASSSVKLRIALGGGRAIARIVDRVILDENADIEVFALSNIPFGDWETSANTNIAVLKRRFWEQKIIIRPLHALQLSPEMDSERIHADRERVLNLEIVQAHFRDVTKCSLVFTGIGSLDDSHLRNRLLGIGIKPSDIEFPAVGDLSYNLIYHERDVFRKNCPLNSRLITVPMDTLTFLAQETDGFVVVVAWGAKKAVPALDAYRASVYNTLIIDEEMAEEMIKLIENDYLEL